MATTRKTSRPAENATPEETPEKAAEVENAEPTPLEEALNEIPTEIEQGSFPYMLAVQVQQEWVKAETANDTILKNTPTPDGIAKFAAETADNDVVKLRTEVQDTESEIAALQEKVETLRETLGRQVDALNGKAKEVMEANMISDAEKTALKAEKDKALKAAGNYMASFKTALPEWEADEGIKTFVGNVMRRVHGAGRYVQQTTGAPINRKSPEVTAWNDRVREWARNNGHRVHERGRIADAIKLAYITANPTDTPPQGA